MYPPVFRALIVAVALTTFAATPAMTQTVVEKRLAALQPCSNLKVTQTVLGLPVTIGIDKLKGVALSRAEIVMAGDDVTLSFVGGLSCRTPDHAAIKGDASVDLTVSAAVNLADCSIRFLSMSPTRFGGRFREVIKVAWGPLIQPELEAKARSMLGDACADFVTGQ
jgi:hypothetical protein